jgi:hypothetical protein
MAENTRARSAERSTFSDAQSCETTAARERTTIGLTSQFNFFFAELRSAVKRPDSLTVGVAGPFDPIGIPDDVNETHAALVSQPDAVSIEEVERCLKVVTDLSKKRKNDMLKTITEAITTERDAHIQTKLAEYEEAMHARMQARDAENGTLHARMQARDAENAAKIAELVKTLEGQIAHTRSPARSAGLNDGGAADSFGDGIAATGGVVASPQFQADIGVDATIYLQFTGGALNSKDEAKLNALPTEPSSALIACVREFCSATYLQQKESAVRGICDIAAGLHGLNTEVLGIVPFSAAIASHLTADVGGSIPSRRDAGGDD